jgi:ketosteroid isomerase-like protein
MSRDDVDTLRSIIEAINQGGPDAGLDFFDPEIEFHEDPKFPEAEVYRGRDAVMHYFREFGASFKSYRFEIEELRDAGDDKVIAIVREHASGKASGLEVHRRSGWVATLRDGKVLRLEIYLDPADALEAAGLGG